MENCYLFYLIRNLLKQNHSSAYGIMFLDFSRLKNNCHLLLYFFTYSNQVASIFTYLFCEWKQGFLKKGFALDRPLFKLWLITCVILGKHLNIKLHFFDCRLGIVLLTSQGPWQEKLNVNTVEASHNSPSINASCYDSCLHLFLFILLVSMDDILDHLWGELEGVGRRKKQLKRSLGKQLCRQALHWISI